MNLLLDTHALLWFLADDPKLSANAKSAIEEPGNQRWLSPISLLEIALKVRLDKLTLHARFADLFPRQLYVNDIHLLPITEAHVEPLTTLALHHRDPFDRLLASTAIVEAMTLVSADAVFEDYGLTRLW